MPTTETQFVIDAVSTPEGDEDFLEKYHEFLCSIIRSQSIFGGRGVCRIHCPQGNTAAILDELTPQILEVCRDFLERRVTEDFIEELRKAHRGESARHISVRTTLQYMLVNKLRNNDNNNLIVGFEGNNINLYLKNAPLAEDWQLENLTCPVTESGPAVPYSRDEVREMLRHFRCMLTRLAGEGDLSVYPTPCECYCLHHDCFGTDRERVVRAYVSDAEKRHKFLAADRWTDEMIGELLRNRYDGVRQPLNHREVTCERRTIVNRRHEYQDRLKACIENYMPDADPKTVEAMLDKRDVDVDTLIDFITDFIRATGMSHAASSEKMKTRTLEEPR